VSCVSERSRLLSFRSLLVVALIVAYVACTPSSGVITSEHIPDAVDSIVWGSINSGEVAGVTVAIMRGDQMILQRGYGFADLTRRTPATAATVYRIGSLTKQFTAVALLRLVDEGRLNLDAPLSAYLPQFHVDGPPVSIRHLLTHTSGIRSYTDLDSATNDMIRHAGTHDVLLAAIANAGFDTPPGDWWHYNNSGYYLLGLVIEQIGHRGFAEYMRDSVTMPAGLAAISECEIANSTPDLAIGYVVTRHRLVPVGPESLLPSFSAGGFCATAGDLAQWQRELHTGRLISERAHTSMVTPAVLSDGTRTSYGFGLFIGALERHMEYSHNGRIDGFSAQAAYYPADGLSVVVLANTETAVAEQLERRISTAILGFVPAAVYRSPRREPDTRQLEGVYFDGPLTIPVWYEHERLALRTPAGDTVFLAPAGRDAFVQQDDSMTTYWFHLLTDHRRRLEVRRNGMLYAMAETVD